MLSGDNESISISDVANTLRSSGVVLPIALYAANPVPASIVEAMLAGATDYLPWPLRRDEIRAALVRIQERADASMERERKLCAAVVAVRRLSRREREVLEAMVQGCSNKEIASILAISPRTVEIHRANVLIKLNARSSADALRIAIYAGLDR